MGREWETVRLGDLGKVVTGKTPSTKKPEYFDGPYPFITIPDMGKSVYIKESARSLSEKGAEIQRSSCLPKDSVMMSCIATIGKCGITAKQSFTNQQINSVICNKNKVLPRYLYYVFTQLGIKLDAAGGGGSVYTNVSKSRFSNIEIDIPSLNEQRKIAHILGTLDDKIELNRRMNATLEEMAQALFKSWFVDFDPVIDNALRAENPIPDELADRAATRKEMLDSGKASHNPELHPLFPDSFRDSELGPIPEGWGVKPLDEIANFLNGLACQKYPVKPGEKSLPVIKIRELRQGITRGTDRASSNVPKKYIIDNGDILFSWSGSLLVETWTQGHGVLNQHVFKISSNKYPKWFYFHWTKHHLKSFQRIAADKATTMGHIKRHHLKDAAVLLPSSSIFDFANNQIGAILSSQIENDLQSRVLCATRDSLLPKLISGEMKSTDKFKLPAG